MLSYRKCISSLFRPVDVFGNVFSQYVHFSRQDRQKVWLPVLLLYKNWLQLVHLSDDLLNLDFLKSAFFSQPSCCTTSFNLFFETFLLLSFEKLRFLHVYFRLDFNTDWLNFNFFTDSKSEGIAVLSLSFTSALERPFFFILYLSLFFLSASKQVWSFLDFLLSIFSFSSCPLSLFNSEHLNISFTSKLSAS